MPKYNHVINYEDLSCINTLMDFWETHHNSYVKNERVFKKYRKIRGKFA